MSSFEVLGVAPDASDAQIKTAYHKLAMRWHPDHNPDNKKAALAKIKDINVAFEWISKHRSSKPDPLTKSRTPPKRPTQSSATPPPPKKQRTPSAFTIDISFREAFYGFTRRLLPLRDSSYSVGFHAGILDDTWYTVTKTGDRVKFNTADERGMIRDGLNIDYIYSARKNKFKKQHTIEVPRPENDYGHFKVEIPKGAKNEDVFSFSGGFPIFEDSMFFSCHNCKRGKYRIHIHVLPEPPLMEKLFGWFF